MARPGTGPSRPTNGPRQPNGAPAIVRRDTPRRVRNGVKLSARDGSLPLTPFTRAWGQLADRQIDPIPQEDGWTYAAAGQVVSMEVSASGLKAYVQGVTRTPYETWVRITPLEPSQWDRVVQAMASEARYAARLLDGLLPDTAVDMFKTHGVAMLPTENDSLNVECSCAAERPCKHAAAAVFMMLDRLATRPVDLLTLRGMPAEHLLERIQQARAIQAHGETAAHVDPSIANDITPPPPLEACIDNFWRSPAEAHDHYQELDDAPLPEHVPHALLRRLGPSPMTSSFPMVGLLASIYDAVGEAAREIRDRGNDESTEQPPDDVSDPTS